MNGKRNEEQKHDIKKIIAIIILILLFLIGATLFAYPIITRTIANNHVEEALYDFEEERQKFIDDAIRKNIEPEKNSDFEKSVDENGVLKENIPQNTPYLDALYQYMKKRNIELVTTQKYELESFTSYTLPEINLEDYGVTSGIIGYIEISSINFKMPILLGTENKSLSKGLGHMTTTSYPIGGKDTNSVFAVHRGYQGADFLKYVDKIQIGDTVMVTNLWYTMEYKVTHYEIIDPYNSKCLFIKPGQDIITLLTCHPFGSNSQRYIVYCERV